MLIRWKYHSSAFSIAASCLLPGTAWGQVSSQSKAAAEALFDEGLAAMKASDYRNACAKLESSQRIEPAVGTLLYLGECFARLERFASAWATFREAASLATTSGQTERANTAKARAAALEGQLSFLTITVSNETQALPGLVVKRDGDTLDPASLGISLPIDPGRLQVEVGAPGYESFRSSIEIVRGARSSLAVPQLRPLAPAPKPAPIISPHNPGAAAPSSHDAFNGPVPHDRRGQNQRIVGLAIAGAGLVGVGLGSYFGIVAMSRDRKADGGYCSTTVCQRIVDYDAARQARKNAAMSNVSFAVGGGAIAIGLLTYWLSPSGSVAALGLQPRLGLGEVGIELRGHL